MGHDDSLRDPDTRRCAAGLVALSGSQRLRPGSLVRSVRSVQRNDLPDTMGRRPDSVNRSQPKGSQADFGFVVSYRCEGVAVIASGHNNNAIKPNKSKNGDGRSSGVYFWSGWLGRFAGLATVDSSIAIRRCIEFGLHDRIWPVMLRDVRRITCNRFFSGGASLWIFKSAH